MGGSGLPFPAMRYFPRHVEQLAQHPDGVAHPGNPGDLRGLFIDSIEGVAAGSLTVVDAVYTYASGAQWHLATAGEVGSLDFRSDAGSIVNLGGGSNMSGALGTSGDGYDFGMEIGLEGIGNKGTYDQDR